MKTGTSKPKILVIGSTSIDLVLNVPEYPGQNETIMATKVESYFGGKGANQAVAAARLGSSVYFLGAVGMDPMGQQVLRNLKDEGVNVDYVHESLESSTGAAYVTAADNKNTIVVVPAANMTLQSEHVQELEKYFSSADILLIQLEIPLKTAEYAVNLAKKNNLKVGIYAAPAKKLPVEILEYASFIVCKSAEIEKIFPSDEKDEILHQYANKLFIRDDANSTTYFNGTEMKYCRTDSSKSGYTMGMGDAFTAGFAVAMCHENSVDECVQFGNSVALKVSEQRGSQKGLPTLKDLGIIDN